MSETVHNATELLGNRTARAPRELSPTAEKILRGARRVLVKKGYAGLTMQAIEREAGVNRSLVHYYFKSKQGLMEALVGRIFEDPNFGYSDAVMAAATGEARVGALLDWLERITGDTASARMLYELLPHILRSRKLRARAADLYETYRQFDGACLAGEDADLGLLEDLGALNVAIVEGLAVQAAVAGADFRLDRAFSLWRDMVLTYLRSGRVQSREAEGP